MQEKHVFVERRISTSIWVTAATCVVVGGLLLYFTSSYNNESKAAYIVAGFLFILIAIAFLRSLSVKRKKITCDLSSCEIASKYIWQSDWSLVARFLWRDVKSTDVESIHIAKSTYHYIFSVFVNSTKNQLVNSNNSSKADFDNLLAFVGRATPQLSYEWVRCTKVGNRPVLQNGFFAKISRN